LNSRGFFDLAGKKERLFELDEEMKGDGFWIDQDLARKKILESTNLKDWVVPIEKISGVIEYLETFYPEAKSEKDNSLIAEMDKELFDVENQMRSLELKRILNFARCRSMQAPEEPSLAIGFQC